MKESVQAIPDVISEPVVTEVPDSQTVSSPVAIAGRWVELNDQIHRLPPGVNRLVHLAAFVADPNAPAFRRRQNVITLAMDVRQGAAWLQQESDLVCEAIDLLLAEIQMQEYQSAEKDVDRLNVPLALALARSIAEQYPKLTEQLLQRITAVEASEGLGKQWIPLDEMVDLEQA